MATNFQSTPAGAGVAPDVPVPGAGAPVPAEDGGGDTINGSSASINGGSTSKWQAVYADEIVFEESDCLVGGGAVSGGEEGETRDEGTAGMSSSLTLNMSSSLPRLPRVERGQDVTYMGPGAGTRCGTQGTGWDASGSLVFETFESFVAAEAQRKEEEEEEEEDDKMVVDGSKEVRACPDERRGAPRSWEQLTGKVGEQPEVKRQGPKRARPAEERSSKLTVTTPTVAARLAHASGRNAGADAGLYPRRSGGRQGTRAGEPGKGARVKKGERRVGRGTVTIGARVAVIVSSASGGRRQSAFASCDRPDERPAAKHGASRVQKSDGRAGRGVWGGRGQWSQREGEVLAVYGDHGGSCLVRWAKMVTGTSGIQYEKNE